MRLSKHFSIVVVAFIVLLGAAGFRSTPSVLIDPLRYEFGWNRATVGLAVSINVLLYGFLGPFAAALQIRYGLKQVTVVALTVMSVGAALTTLISQAWHLFLLWGFVIGAGAGCMATVFASTVAASWFVARRGIVTGVLTAASASGQLIFLPMLSYLAERYGWRSVAVTVAVAAALVIPVVLLFMRNRPEDVGLLPYGANHDAPATVTVGNPVKNAMESLRVAWGTNTFWLLWGSFAVCGLSTTGLVQTHFISAGHDHGMTHTQAGTYLALLGVFDIFGTIASGWLTDRFDPRRLLATYYMLRGLSLFILDPALATGGGGLFGFIVFYGLDWVATVPPTIALCIDHFGKDRGTLVYGWVFAGHQVGGAIAAWGAGKLRETTGTYRPAFVLAGFACAFATFGVLRIKSVTDTNTRPAVTHSG